MLKRLRSAHPMLYCLVAEVLFLGMLFVASLLSLLLILFVVRDIDAVDDYMLTFMQEAAGVLVAWLFLARTGKSGLLRRRGSGFFNGLLVGPGLAKVRAFSLLFIYRIEYNGSSRHTVLRAGFGLYHPLSARHIRLFDKEYLVPLQRRKTRHRGRSGDVLFYI